MPRMPSAEFEITAALAAALVADQFPALAHLPVTLLAEGWDNVVFRLGATHTIRLPRRQLAVPLIEKEQHWLPDLAWGVRVPIPAPLHCGRPGLGYPWPWSILPWVDGDTVTRLAIDRRRSLAIDLAAFVADLHTPAPAGAPVNPVRGVRLHHRDKATIERLDGNGIRRADELRALWATLRNTPAWAGPAVWLHGDLHPGNLLHLEGRLAGVVDFGDLGSGDPACDLASAWLTFDAEGRGAFFEALPERYRRDGDLRARSRGWALSLTTALAAHSDDNPGMAAVGEHAIDQVLDHP